MPIKGLSETRRPTRGGKVRLGEKRTNKGGKEYPAATDYFVFDPVDPSMSPVFVEKYGDRPTTLLIEFASDDPEQVFPQWYKCYGTSGLLCKGDGETANRMTEDGEMAQVPCPGPDACPFAQKRGSGGRAGCKAVASLQFVLPDLPALQVWQMDTGSVNTILNINSALDMLHTATGGLAGRPVKLVRREQQVTVEGKAKTVFVVDLHIPYGLNQLRGMKASGFLALEALADVPELVEDVAPDDLYPTSQVAECSEDDNEKRKADYDEAVRLSSPKAVHAMLKDAGCVSLNFTPPSIMARVLDQVRVDVASSDEHDEEMDL